MHDRRFSTQYGMYAVVVRPREAGRIIFEIKYFDTFGKNSFILHK